MPEVNRVAAVEVSSEAPEHPHQLLARPTFAVVVLY